MQRREFLLVPLAAGACAALGQDTTPTPKPALGMLLYSFGIRVRNRREERLGEPANFLKFCHEQGASGVQMSLGALDDAASAAVREQAEKLGMHVEGIVSCPRDQAGVAKFEAELRTAKACGAGVLRTVMLGGRRYEEFDRAEQYREFAKRAEASLRLAAPLAAKHGVKLAVENHKDFRTDEQLALLKQFDGEYVGVCLDTGNNIALLEEPHAVVQALAPRTFTVHLKDMGLEQAADGFRLSEVPLGRGMLDLQKVVGEIRSANPQARFNLEMITRDPLSIPCLTEKFWATLQNVAGLDLARTLAMVRDKAADNPLPRVTPLPPAEQLAREEENVRVSLEYSRKLPGLKA